jgi:hypothetical protein
MLRVKFVSRNKYVFFLDFEDSYWNYYSRMLHSLVFITFSIVDWNVMGWMCSRLPSVSPKKASASPSFPLEIKSNSLSQERFVQSSGVSCKNGYWVCSFYVVQG